jgi:hypothetical protein
VLDAAAKKGVRNRCVITTQRIRAPRNRRAGGHATQPTAVAVATPTAATVPIAAVRLCSPAATPTPTIAS